MSTRRLPSVLIGFAIGLVPAVLGAEEPQAGAVPAARESPSGGRTLLFSADEAAAIRRALAGQVAAESPVQPEQGEASGTVRPTASNIFVSGLVDLGDGQWTVWANGYRISPEHQAPGFRVVSVRKDEVEIVVDGESPARFHLHPYQTWRVGQRDIVEGIVP